jgi:hypothetical protein
MTPADILSPPPPRGRRGYFPIYRPLRKCAGERPVEKDTKWILNKALSAAQRPEEEKINLNLLGWKVARCRIVELNRRECWQQQEEEERALEDWTHSLGQGRPLSNSTATTPQTKIPIFRKVKRPSAELCNNAWHTCKGQCTQGLGSLIWTDRYEVNIKAVKSGEKNTVLC